MKNKVSIIVPTYKRASIITRSLDSILAQTYTNYEVIIVDDNAADKKERAATKKAVAPYLKSKKFQFIERKTNGGGGATRNTGLDKATGEYVTFLDDDDEFYPEYLKKHLDNIIKTKADVSVCASVTVNDLGEQVTEKNYNDYNPNQNLMAYHVTDMIVGTQTFFSKTEAVRAIGGFEPVPAGQDFVFIYNLIENNSSFSFIKEPLTRVYVHSQERITVGTKKITGEKKIYKMKKKYFYLLNGEGKRKVKFRFYSIMFSTNFKIKSYGKALVNLVLAFVTRPAYFMKVLLRR